MSTPEQDVADLERKIQALKAKIAGKTVQACGAIGCCHVGAAHRHCADCQAVIYTYQHQWYWWNTPPYQPTYRPVSIPYYSTLGYSSPGITSTTWTNGTQSLTAKSPGLGADVSLYGLPEHACEVK